MVILTNCVGCSNFSGECFIVILIFFKNAIDKYLHTEKIMNTLEYHQLFQGKFSEVHRIGEGTLLDVVLKCASTVVIPTTLSNISNNAFHGTS